MARSVSHLWELFEPVVQGMGYELIEIEYQPNPNYGVLRLYIDKDSGIEVDDCSAVSRQISAILDVEDPVPGKFNLEVSSPGMDRPLRRLEDFQRFVGEEVKVKTGMPFDGQRNFKGLLNGIEDDLVIIECENKEVRLPVTAIDKARLVPDFDKKSEG
ncbi:ribosome maturation factor RimP [Pseudomonadota bacterium]